jgi:hypothetical protein
MMVTERSGSYLKGRRKSLKVGSEEVVETPMMSNVAGWAS